MTRPLRIAIVGSGPSGMYAADALLSQREIPVQVDVIDSLPVPFGLVRYGVAPDHLSIRSVRDTLDRILDAPGIRFLGNITVGEDLTAAELRAHYDAVILAYGASRDRRLGIPGEDCDGSVAATDFVAWYTGHPDADRATFERLLPTARTAVIVGVGNVAVDVTRVLAKTPAELAHTDMPQHVLDTLAAQQITDLHVLGRRGPAQATFTTKELRELGELADADILVDPAEVVLDAASEEAVAADRTLARNLAVIREWSERTPAGRARRIHLRFLTRPVALHGAPRVTEVEVEATALDGSGGVTGTGRLSRIPADLVVRSVGYRGVALPGLPFDERANVIPHRDGRVVADGAVLPGWYVAGWIKRGPSGIIGTNKKDAAATVAALLADAAGLPRADAGDDEPIDGRLTAQGRPVVTTAGWRAIDAAERALGARTGRDRTTIHERAALLAAAR